MADNPDRPTLADFSQTVHLGPTADQLTFISSLADWLDLRPDEVVEIAIDLIPRADMERRTITLVTDLKISEASELIEDLKSRREIILAERRAYGRSRR